MSGACGYTHDVSGPRFDDLACEEWTCGREPVEDRNRCAFHAPPEVGDDAARERLLEAVAEEAATVRLIGARLGELSLDYTILDGPSNHPVDLREATVTGELSVRHATVDRPLRFEGATLAGAVDFEDTTFKRRVEFAEVDFDGTVSMQLADFESWLDLGDATFREQAYMRIARFRRGIFGVDATFERPADFLNTRFDDIANFYGAAFLDGAVFDNSTFEGNLAFIEATFEGPAVRLPSARESPQSPEAVFEGVALSVHGIVCRKNVRLTDASLSGDVRFTEGHLASDLECTGVSPAAGPVTVDCTGTETVGGTVSAAGGEVTYDLTEATVGELSVTDGSLDACRFDGTRFRGFDFGAYKRDLAAQGWRLHDEGLASEANPERLENLYLRAKNGANAVGETRAAAEFFIREMTYRRRGHRHRVVHGDGAGARLRALGGWLSNAGLQASCGYGERPFRPVVASGALVCAFTVVFAMLDAPVTYAEPLGYLVLSTEGFVSLVLGLPEVSGTLVSFAVVSEAFLGGFAIALFVFTLTRSVSR